MKNKIFSAIKHYLIPIVFSVWELIALWVDHSYFFPPLLKTLSALKNLLISVSTYSAIFVTVLRIITGVLIGTALGTLLAVVSHKFDAVRAVLSPLVSVMKITPIAIFYSLLYIKLGRVLPELVAVLMVIPIIWQNLINGYNSIDKSLSELCDVYEFSHFKRFRYLTFPALFRYFIPALITAVGIAFKAEISMEILLFSIDSIGGAIFDAKQVSDTATVFAWAIIIVLLGILTEKLSKALLWRYENGLNN